MSNPGLRILAQGGSESGSSAFRRLCLFLGCFTVLFKMPRESDVLKIGDLAPDWKLSMAGAPEHWISLADVLASGPAIVEFLRGTW